MSTEELRARARKAIESLPPRVLEKFVELLEEVLAVSGQDDHEERVQRLIDKNRGLLMRLAKHDQDP